MATTRAKVNGGIAGWQPWGEQKDPAAGSVLKMEATGLVEILMWDMRESNGPGRSRSGDGRSWGQQLH